MARRRGRPINLDGPILKWAGGKTRLIPLLDEIFPDHVPAYHEPFVGAGAVFFHLAAANRFDRAHLSDSNPDLVSMFVAIRDEPDAVLGHLTKLKARHDEEHFYAVRERFNRGRSARPVRAAELIYLNKTGYNGLYRVNSKGAFNVPFGRYVEPQIFIEEQIRRAADRLRGVTIEARDFATVAKRAEAGDLVYLDPPYVPLSKSAFFTAYAKESFGAEQQELLAEVFRALDERGVLVVLSNHDTPRVRELYAGFERREAQLSRFINSRAERRGTATAEVVVIGKTLASRRGAKAKRARNSAGRV